MDPELMRKIDRWRREEDRRSVGPRSPRRHRVHRLLRAVPGAVGTGARAAPGLVAHMWRRQTHICELLLETQQPWRSEGPMRWEGSGARARLLGCHLPADTVESGAAPGPGARVGRARRY